LRTSKTWIPALPKLKAMLDYDREAPRYDDTRGGEARAQAAAAAIERLLPENACVVGDFACGTGIVTGLLRRPGRSVLGVDRSAGMLSLAAGRLPGAVLRADATAVPLASGGLDAVVIIWLLHLLEDAAPALAEAARVLRPGGLLITTVDKDAGGSIRPEGPAADRFERVAELAAGHGLRPVGETGFTGVGQGRGGRPDPVYRLVAFG
jgi:ubiquinone/menaquinone biosynthesis C-methylase UbiE